MKFGMRTSSPKRSFKARTTGKWKRQAKRDLIPRIREEGYGVDTELQESRLQQDLPEDHVQHLGHVQARRMIGPASGVGGGFFCEDIYPTNI